MAASNGVFIIHPKGPGLSDITCDFSTGATDYEVLKDSVNAHEERRLQVAYSNVAGGIARATRDLVPFEFDIVIFGASHENMLANAKALFRTLTDPHGGTVEVLYPGLDTSTLHTYYHYLQSPAPQRKSPIGATQYAITQSARAATDEMIRYGVQLTTKAWATSDPDSYVTLASGQTADNEGDSVVLNNTAIKGDAVQAVLEITGNEASGDVLKDLIVCVRKMRDGNNSDLEWVEAEDMGGLIGGAPAGWDYGVFVPIRWRAPTAEGGYPVDIVNNGFDTATLVTATKMQADGDDLRVYVGSSQYSRWLQDMNNATTQVWARLDFSADIPMTLDGNITSTALSLAVNEDISGMPSSGILRIDAENMEYTSKDDGTKTFALDSRGYGNSTIAAHVNTTATYWIQNDLWIYYGNSGAGAPSADDDSRPAFDLDSTNGSWVYSYFGENDGLRAKGWVQQVVHSWSGSPDFYTGHRYANPDPWEEISISVLNNPSFPYRAAGRWYLYNACGITDVNFSNGEKWRAAADWGTTEVQSSINGSAWTQEYVIPTPGSDFSWEAWNYSAAITASSKYAALYIDTDAFIALLNTVECADVTLTLDGGNTPLVVTIESESTFAGGGVSDSNASGNAYSRTTSDTEFTIASGNRSGMDRTYTGKIVPIVVARCPSGVRWTLQWKSYISSRDNVVQEGNVITLVGNANWQCLHTFSEIDFPPFPIPDRISEANVDNYMEELLLDLVVRRTLGSGPLDLDLVWLAKAGDWISHVYNAVGDEGLKASGGNIAVIDSIARSCFLRDSSDSVVQVLNYPGSPIDELILHKQYDHRIRLVGYKDQSTLKYTATFDFLVTVKALHLTIYPFEVS